MHVGRKGRWLEYGKITISPSISYENTCCAAPDGARFVRPEAGIGRQRQRKGAKELRSATKILRHVTLKPDVRLKQSKITSSVGMTKWVLSPPSWHFFKPSVLHERGPLADTFRFRKNGYIWVHGKGAEWENHTGIGVWGLSNRYWPENWAFQRERGRGWLSTPSLPPRRQRWLSAI